MSQVRGAEMRAELAEARLARRRQRAAMTGMPWASAARRFAQSFVAEEPVARRMLVHWTPPSTGRPLHVGAASGRVVRRPPRRRGAAARSAGDDGGDGSDGSDGDPPSLPRDRRLWAHAPVFAERIVFDSHGVEWMVRELDAAALPGARSQRCLIVENHQVVRKLWHYPADWTLYGDAALLAMSEEGT